MKKIRIGFILIVIGVISITSNLGVLNPAWALPLLSIVFFGMYFITGHRKSIRSVGFLIPACILLMIGLYALIADESVSEMLEATVFFLFLGTAFWMIYFIHTLWHKECEFGYRHWPAFIGLGLYVFAGLMYLVDVFNWDLGLKILSTVWPAGLVILGIYLIMKNRHQINSRDN